MDNIFLDIFNIVILFYGRLLFFYLVLNAFKLGQMIRLDQIASS